MAPNMGLATENSFANSTRVIDRFRVVRLVTDALCVKLLWKAIEEENTAIKQAKEKGEKYYLQVLSKEIL